MADNATTVPRCSEDLTWKTDIKLFAHVLNLVVSLVGNIALCVVVKRNKKLRKTMDFLIVNNAVSDLAIPLLAIPRILIELAIRSPKWQIDGGMLGEVCCKVVYFLTDACPMVSIITLVYLTASRFCAVVFPFHAARAPKELRIYYIGSSWIISLAFCSPYLFYIKLRDDDGLCIMSWTQRAHNIYSTILVIFFIIIPLVITVTMYSVILFHIRRRSNRIPMRPKSARKKDERLTRNMTLLSFCIVLAFLLCWGPYFSIAVAVIYFKNIIIKLHQMCYLNDFYFIAKFLAYSNASITPLLCLIFIENYRNGLKRVLGFKMTEPSTSVTALVEKQRTLLRRSTFTENACYVSAVWWHSMIVDSTCFSTDGNKHTWFIDTKINLNLPQ